MKLIRAVLVSILALLLSLGNISPSIAVSWQEQMLSSLNMIRAENGLKPVKLCNSLTKSAQSYAQEMATQDFFSHEGKDGSTQVREFRELDTTGAIPGPLLGSLKILPQVAGRSKE